MGKWLAVYRSYFSESRPPNFLWYTHYPINISIVTVLVMYQKDMIYFMSRESTISIYSD